jgi:hypothetical protein
MRRMFFTFFAMLLILLFALNAKAQTFRGAINGTVTDPSGASVPDAQVKATEKTTDIAHTTVTTSDGLFVFQDLAVGTYAVTVTAAGFPVLVVENISVQQGAIYTLAAKLSLSKQATTVEVSAAALSLDTTTETQTTAVSGDDLQTMPQNGRDFTQLIQLTPGYGGYSAGGYGSVNGTRANQVNWQIDGVDNNDLWHNIPAVNQGGVSGIAGIVLPIDAVDQFSVQTQAAPESGRNPGGTVDLALKSGGNEFHGTLYAFFRNEAFAAASPFVDSKKENRNYQYGFSAGGPVLKDKLFFFLTFEKQRFTIGLPGLGTEPSVAYQAASTAVLSAYGLTPNTVSTQLLANLWPSYALQGPAAPNNYSSPDPEFGYSYNGLGKIDYKINDKNSLTFHYFSGQGSQVAPVGGSALSQAASELKYYYEIAPIHVSNYALVWNSALSQTLSNQLLLGVNYFHQKFNDENSGFNVSNYGLVLSPTFGASGLTGAPNINISGFDQTGLTPPEGREDITGHLTDDLSYTVGKHQFRFGGEFRRAQLEEFYHRHALGSLVFDGSQADGTNGKASWDKDFATCSGPYFTAPANATQLAACKAGTFDQNILRLSDFMAGYLNDGASSIAQGDPTRLVYVKTFALFAQDAWQVNRKLTVNYGVRWDYEGPFHDDKKDLSVFIPSKGGLVFQGAGINNIYPASYKNFSPRIGFAYKPEAAGDLVVRAGFGVFFDTPNLNPFLDNRPNNGAPNGVEGNPAGPNPVDTVPAAVQIITAGVPVFPAGGAVCPTGNGCGETFNIFSISQDFRNAYNYNYNLNIEKALGKSILLQVGYVGSAAHRLLTTQDINQPALSASGTGVRPYAAQFPDFGIINQIESNGNSNYNSFQAVVKVRDWHRFTSQFTYTWAHALDDMTAYRGAIPQNSFFVQGDYGNSDFDTRHNFTGLLNYDLPNASSWRLLRNGWVLSSLLSFHTGQPFTVYSSSDTTGTNEQVQRADQIGNPYAGVSHAFSKTGVQWINPAAFADPAPGTFGNSPRNGYYGPGFGDVDFSVVKNTKVSERINVQFRVELFNLFNRINLAPPNGTRGGGFGVSSDTIGDYNGAPGIGPGEAFNMQLALKVIF